jgi:hypothetical protein
MYCSINSSEPFRNQAIADKIKTRDGNTRVNRETEGARVHVARVEECPDVLQSDVPRAACHYLSASLTEHPAIHTNKL